MSTPPSSAAHGTWFCFLAVLYSAWKVNGVPEQSAMLVFMKPFAALAVMNPVLWVLISRTTAVSPRDESEMEVTSTSPGVNISVWRFGVNVCRLASCGFGGPVGTPLVCMNAKLTGSMQLLLQVAKLKVHARLSMVRGAHHWVRLQLTESKKGG